MSYGHCPGSGLKGEWGEPCPHCGRFIFLRYTGTRHSHMPYGPPMPNPDYQFMSDLRARGRSRSRSLAPRRPPVAPEAARSVGLGQNSGMDTPRAVRLLDQIIENMSAYDEVDRDSSRGEAPRKLVDLDDAIREDLVVAIRIAEAMGVPYERTIYLEKGSGKHPWYEARGVLVEMRAALTRKDEIDQILGPPSP